jgi:hypothetical protein
MCVYGRVILHILVHDFYAQVCFKILALLQGSAYALCFKVHTAKYFEVISSTGTYIEKMYRTECMAGHNRRHSMTYVSVK